LWETRLRVFQETADDALPVRRLVSVHADGRAGTQERTRFNFHHLTGHDPARQRRSLTRLWFVSLPSKTTGRITGTCLEDYIGVMKKKPEG
jgi:hypothetical protein